MKMEIEQSSDSLPPLLDLENLQGDHFRNRRNQANANRSLFGGQIVAQSLAAADRTVENRTAHSLHAYFLRAGNSDLPVDFAVTRVRDGGRFSTRRVEASQEGSIIFTMDCSYRAEIEGFSHQIAPTATFDPEKALDLSALRGRNDLPFHNIFDGRYPIDVRIPEEAGFLAPKDTLKRHYWLRAKGVSADDSPVVHQQALAFLSDFMMPGVALVPHTVPLPGPHIFVASIDHALWFHRPVRADDWLLFETDTPSAEGSVNFARGLVYDRAGRLVASIAQEALQFLR